MNRNPIQRLLVALILTVPVATVQAREDDIFAEYRAMFGEDNPAELVEMQGEELWNAARGPKQVALDGCDLGLGAGVTKGAYAQLPRWFEDAGKVMDLETRLLFCMERLQGLDVAALRKQPYSEQGQQQTDLESLSAFIAAQSRGLPIAVPQSHPAERAAFASGAKFFNFRGGPHDFSCATCHSQDGKRIRLQSLLQLNSVEGAKASFATWPAYRIAQGAVRTIEWRMADCARQQRLPGLVHGSQVAIDLITYLGVQANGAVLTAPGLKR
ncbi:MAG TPA: sulfur oxidation c-type cytochrome SoxA [Patescibacteria group bacterium]|nr:sulfur oxidation c-type cytochrome SoxA [Patescibacteria group bacterium]